MKRYLCLLALLCALVLTVSVSTTMGRYSTQVETSFHLTVTPATRSLAYDPNGGVSFAMDNVETQTNPTFVVADAPVRQYLAFQGWSDGEALYQPGEEYTLPEDTMDGLLTAVWGPIAACPDALETFQVTMADKISFSQHSGSGCEQYFFPLQGLEYGETYRLAFDFSYLMELAIPDFFQDGHNLSFAVVSDSQLDGHGGVNSLWEAGAYEQTFTAEGDTMYLMLELCALHDGDRIHGVISNLSLDGAVLPEPVVEEAPVEGDLYWEDPLTEVFYEEPYEETVSDPLAQAPEEDLEMDFFAGDPLAS